MPQVFVNTSNLTLFVRVTDLAFGGASGGLGPALVIDHVYNQDDTGSGALGAGWSFSLGDRISTEADGSLTLRRGTGRVDHFASATGSTTLFAVTSTQDSLVRAADGTYTLTTPGSTSGSATSGSNTSGSNTSGSATSGPAASRVFSADGKLLSVLDGARVRVSLEYDAAGHLTVAHYRGKLVNFATDSSGRITSIKDAAGRSVSFSFNGDGRLAQQTNADGQTVSYQYDGTGNLNSIAYAGGKVAIAYSGDSGFAGVSSVTTPDGAVRQYDTPRTASEVRVVDGNGDATLYTSSALGLLQSITDAAGNTVSYSYDAAGNRTRVVNAAGEAVAFTYDASGNLTGITDGGNNRWSADYTTGGPAHVTDPNRNVWTLRYDDSGNLIGVTNPVNGTTSATRNAAGQIASLADPAGGKGSYQYNPDGLLIGFTDALNNKWAYDYDGAARPATRTDPLGVTLQTAYTPGNRIAGLTASQKGGSAQVSFDYSGIQRDSLGRLTGYTDSFGNQLTYAYDAAGQTSGLTLPGGKTVTYQYDHLHRLSKVSDWQGNFALYRYDLAGFPVSVAVSGGPVTIYQYDGARNLRAIVSTGPDGQPVAAYRYNLDSNGNRTAVSALEPNTASFTLPSYSFGYDTANHPVTRSDGQNYKYDADGNLTDVQGARNLTLGYDPFGRLQSISGDITTSYAYDSTGLRVARGDAGTGRRYVYDLAGERPRIVMETDGSNVPIAYYVYGLGLLWKVTAGGAPYFYHFDGDGNVVALSSGTSGVVNQYRYDPQGRLLSANEGVENLFHAHGEAGWVDDGNGLLFTGAQFQFPELRITLPATADPAPPAPDLRPRLSGAGACFIEGVANCLAGSGRRDR